MLRLFYYLKISDFKINFYTNLCDYFCFFFCVFAAAEYFGYENKTFFVKICLSPDGKYLLSGSSDTYAYIWRTSKPGSPLVRLTGHAAEVTCIDWCSVGETKVFFLTIFFEKISRKKH